MDAKPSRACSGRYPRKVLPRDWSPIAALRGHARDRPDEVAVIYPTAGEWRWRSWEWLAWQVAKTASQVERHPGRTVGFADWPAPGRLALDLAVQALGRISTPIGQGTSWPAVDLTVVGVHEPGPENEPAVVALELLAEVGPELPDPDRSAVALGSLSPKAGGVRVGGAAGVEWDAARRATAARAIETALGRGATRDIALVTGSLSGLVVRAWLDWGLATGAALVLVPNQQELAVDFRWIRPTVACLTGAEAAAVQSLLDDESSRRLRRWYGRCRALLVSAGSLTVSGRAFWSGLGTAVVEASSLEISRG